MRARDGFSLLEAVFALALLGAVAVSALVTTAAQTDTGVRSLHLIEAGALAELEIARLAALDPLQLRAAVGERDGLAYDPPFEIYHGRTRLTRLAGDTTVFEAHVVIDWGAGEYELATLMHRPMRGAGP